MDAELFDAPFNLSGEEAWFEISEEGEARVRALAESEARKAQGTLFCLKCRQWLPSIPGHERSTWRHCPCGHVAIKV